VDGVAVRVLSAADTLVYLCVHLATHLVEREARVGQAVDIARFLRLHADALDWDAALAAGRAARVSRFVYLALYATERLTGAPLPPPAVLDALRADTPERLREWVERDGATDLLAMDYRVTDLTRAYALTFAAARSWGERARVVRFALLPPMDTLRAEYGGRGPWLYARHLQGRGRVYLAALRRGRVHPQIEHVRKP
jgi:hypothetical protein